MREILTSPRSAEIKHSRRVKSIRTGILFTILILSFIGACGYFSADRHLLIQKINISGTHIINSSDVEAVVNEALVGRYMYLFSKSNSLIYPKHQIYNKLIDTYPSIDELSIYRTNRNTLHIDIKERLASYLYCGSTVPESKESIGDNCYFINTDGYVFDKAPYFSGNIYFKYYVPLPDTSKIIDQYILPVDQFHSLVRFIDDITSLGFKPIYLTLGTDSTYSLYLDHNTVDTSPKIIWKYEDDLQIILDNLSVAMKKPEFANEINSKYATLLYIDLRFKNKVLYKFQ